MYNLLQPGCIFSILAHIYLFGGPCIRWP